MRICRLLLLLGVTGLVFAMPATSSAAQGLSVLGDGDLAIASESDQDTTETTLTVLNSGPSPATITVRADASSAPKVAVLRSDPKTIPPHGAERVTVTLAGTRGLHTKVRGALVVVTAGGRPIAVAARPFVVTPGVDPLVPWPEVIGIGALAVIVLYPVLAVIKLGLGKEGPLRKPAPGPKWSFESWGTTLTAVGAVLGTVLGSATLPDVPRQIDKDALIALNLLFGVLVVVGPFVFQAARKPGASPADQEAGLWGNNFTLVVACAITGAAVLGEIATLGVGAWEVVGGGAAGAAAVVVAVAVFCLAAYYFATTAWSLAKTDWVGVKQKADAAAKKTKRFAIGAAGAGGEQAEVAVEVPVQPTSVNWSLL